MSESKLFMLAFSEASTRPLGFAKDGRGTVTKWREAALSQMRSSYFIESKARTVVGNMGDLETL